MDVTMARLLAALALLATACGGADGQADTAAEVSTDDRAPLALLALVDPAAEFSVDAAATFTGAGDQQPLDEGHVVRTDDTGFALVEYLDNLAVARLDRNTTYEVVRLDASAEAPEVTVRLDVGRVWHNVDADAIDTFTVETAVATLAVRGTIFLVSCPDRTLCEFAVVEGRVEVTPRGGDPVALTASEQVTVVATGDDTAEADPVEPATSTEPGADGFVDRNRALDAGQDDPGPSGGTEAAAFTVFTELPERQRSTMDGICLVALEGSAIAVGEVNVLGHWDPPVITNELLSGGAGPGLVEFGEPFHAAAIESDDVRDDEGWRLQTPAMQRVLASIHSRCAALGWEETVIEFALVPWGELTQEQQWGMDWICAKAVEHAAEPVGDQISRIFQPGDFEGMREGEAGPGLIDLADALEDAVEDAAVRTQDDRGTVTRHFQTQTSEDVFQTVVERCNELGWPRVTATG